MTKTVWDFEFWCLQFRETIGLSSADKQHNLNYITFFQRPPGILLSRDKPLVIDHHLDRQIQFSGLVQQYFTRRPAMPFHNMRDKIRHRPAGHFQFGLSAN